ncbi:DUF4292 domain-containing protein [Geofilum rhodophaeum]|uniref:DUF4292 domain-containing protein n=1 Tax=Geofilum rhodophaeum TaxID=1965019 RepID=UPI0013142A8B|nr:DUF4292 domain-containing protein [Geofilum rhodophaeum]
MNERELIKAIEDNALDYQHLFFRRAFVEFKQNGKSQAVRANIYIRKDSAIIVSVIPVMGIEMYRLQLSKNEIIVLDRLNRKVMRSDYKSLSQRFLFDFNFLQFQQILSNGVFVFPEGRGSLRSFKMQRDSMSYLLTSGTNQDGSHQYLRFMPDAYRLLSSEVQFPDRDIVMELAYSDFLKVDGGFLFPSLIFMEGQRLQDSITLSIQLSSIEVDGSQSLNFSIPSGYDEVHF